MTTTDPIPTHEALTGRIATDPLVKYTSKGEPRLYFRVGREYWSKDTDGEWRQHQETTFHHVSIYGAAALHARDHLQKGDWIILVGRTRSYTHADGETGHEFSAWSYGPDAKRHTVHIDRTTRRATTPATTPPGQANTPTAPIVDRTPSAPRPPSSGLGL